MIKTLRKYSVMIGLMAFSILLYLFFYPKQIEAYTHKDVKQLEEASFYGIIIFEIVLIGLFLVPILMSTKGFSKKVGQFLGALAIGYIMFTGFESIFVGSYLYLNKQQTKGEIIRDYKIASKHLTGDTYHLTFLVDANHSEFVDRHIKLSITDYNKLDKENLVQLKFKEGWFGIKHSPELLIP